MSSSTSSASSSLGSSPEERETSTKPFLLLDIDGALSPMIDPYEEGADELLWVTDLEGVSPQLPRWLAELSQHFELAWASSWESEANEVFGPALGLGELPFVHFTRISDDWTWKLPCVMEFVGNRTFAWIDDVLGPDALAAGANHPFGACLLRTKERSGITEEHFQTLLDFAASL